ncbi:MAG: CoA pyrophosphatase [Thermodesulfobacteriota bacterium]
MKDLPEIIRSALAERTPALITSREGPFRRAAVLIPLFRANGEYRILFTKRTNRVEAHKGQISFPGGGVDEGDASEEETALREAEEEIGLRREDVMVLGRTDDALTMVSNYIVHPFVGLIPYPYEFKINTREVDRILDVPFHVFLPQPGGDRILPVRYEGGVFEGLAYTYEGDVIWGATARIMKNFMLILAEKLGLPERN